MLLQSEPIAHGLELSLIDVARAAWVLKGRSAAARRALQAPAWQLKVLAPTHPHAPDAAWFDRTTMHRRPRDAFWRHGRWDTSVDSDFSPYGFTGKIDPRTGAFVDYHAREFGPGAAIIATKPEPDQIALDTLLAVFLRGAPPAGVYLLADVL